MSGLLGAVQFLTRLPLRLSAPTDHGRVLAWFPIVGALIGAACGGVAWLAGWWLAPTVSASLAVGCGLLVTGAFHEDGLADMADAFGGGWTIEDRVRILKDSRHGTYGVAALCSSIVMRVIAVAALPSGAAMFASLVVAHSTGRAAAVAAARVVPPAGDGGLGAAAGRSLSSSRVIFAVVSAALIAVLAVGWWTLPLFAAAAVVAAIVCWLSIRKIGGVVGDVLGAVEQVVEIAVLVVASGLATRHSLWWR